MTGAITNFSTVATVGASGGPCSPACRHQRCDTLRRDAAAPCDVCGQPIGYETEYAEVDGGDGFLRSVHRACIESKRLDSPQPKEKPMSEQNGTKQEKDRTHLAVVGAMPLALGLMPRTMDEAMSMSKLLAESALLPTHLRGKPADVLVTMLKGLELGLKPMVAFSEIYVVNGRPGCSAALKRAIVESQPDCEEARFTESTATKATYMTKKKGRAPTSKTFTIEDAQRAGLTSKDVWKSHPAAMLRARASGAECDAEWSRAIQGMKSLDELQEIEGSVVEVRPNKPSVESAAAPVRPSPPVSSTPPAPPKPPSSVPDEPVDDDFERLAKVEEPPKEEPPPSNEPSAFEKLTIQLNEATEPKHLEALHGAIKAHPNPDEQKSLKQLYIRRSTDMVNARKAAGAK